MINPIRRLQGVKLVLCLFGFTITACSSTAETAVDPTQETSQPQDQPANLRVPYGNAPELDGHFAPGEWDQALRFEMSDGGWVQFLQDGEFLYIGIASEGLGFGSLCWERQEQVWILHSSAALGAAVFQAEGEAWRLIQDFNWCCRSQVDLSQRQSLFERQGWMASIGYMGAPTEMEYQIAWEGRIRLGVVYRTGDDLYAASHWPSSLADACLDLALGSGDLPELARFDVDSWGLLIQAEN